MADETPTIAPVEERLTSQTGAASPTALKRSVVFTVVSVATMIEVEASSLMSKLLRYGIAKS